MNNKDKIKITEEFGTTVMRPNKIIVGISGHMGVGKTTAAKIFEKYGYTIIKFADPLKSMLKTLGMTEEQLNGTKKSMPIPWLGDKTPRYIQQTLGTQWGRMLINDDIWVNVWEFNIYNKTKVVADDIRFPNEAKRVHYLHGRIIKIIRPNYNGDNHESETFIDNVPHNFLIENNGSLEEYQQKIEGLIKQCFI